MSDDDLIRRGDAYAICRPMNGSNALDEAAAAIAALPAAVPGVKPLVWEAGERDQRRADSILGEFCVTFFGGHWFYQGEPRKGMLDAQAAAQQDYESRILSALAPQPARDVREAALREAAQVCAAMANQVADAALTGLTEQARVREAMEAAFTKAQHRILALIGDRP